MKSIKFFFACVLALTFVACSNAESDSFEDNSSNFESSDLTYNINKTLVYDSPWRIPSAYVCDLNASYRFKIGGVNAILSGVVNNLFDQEYISDATDGSNHDWQTAYGIFYGFGRTYNLKLKLNF